MPKPIINTDNIRENQVSKNGFTSLQVQFETPDTIFRKKRSNEYINTIKKLDITGHSMTREQIDEIINAVKLELPVLSINDLPIGIVAKCYLGEPYEVHTLSFLGNAIVKHYKHSETLPDGLEKARTLANNENYSFVEVYQTKIIAVKEDGSVAILEDK